MASPSLAHNVAEYSVSEISSAIKRTMEDTFGYVRVRGEISGFRGQHSSGHSYFCLKDETAKLEAVVWKGTYGKLPVKPQEGLEVVATGRITTYPGKSNYQIVIESMEPAGIGALMALLEKRKKELEAEGLFRPERKRRLPFMPSVIGVITSPTGAVIRDILHRIADRFPVHVLVWPVAVQGEGAAEQVAAAIAGFNSMMPGGATPKPDVLIVARGGGSLEDLWAFNEEIVVRAVANSTIPLISAVGHETDTTLIDFASDMRAPTPTAAAELAVPVREEWLYSVVQLGGRLSSYILRLLQEKGERVSGLARGLPRPAQLLEYATQRLDDWSERLHSALPSLLLQKEKALHVAIASLRPQALAKDITGHWERVADWSERLQNAMPTLFQQKEKNLHVAVAGLRPQVLAEEVRWCQERLDELFTRVQQSYMRNLQDKEQRLISLAQLVEQLNYTRVLERGFALVRNEAGQIMRSVKQVTSGEKLQLQFHDGKKKVVAE